MGPLLSVIRALIVPAVISLILFLLSTYVAAPFYRRYRARYAQYLPLDTLSNRTSSIRDRAIRYIAERRRRLLNRIDSTDLSPDSEADDDDDQDVANAEDGEELTALHERARGPALREAQARPGPADQTRRLSRDLEEGFRDDSEDE